jgi:hypothetical protein
MVEEAFNRKSDELNISEQSCMTLMKLIDDQKRNIKNLQLKIKKRDEEENQRKLYYTEKDQEIHFLKNFINSLKSESNCKIDYLYLVKEQSLSSVKNKLEKAKNENKQLTSVIQSSEIKKKKIQIVDHKNGKIQINSNYINSKISPIAKKHKTINTLENNFGNSLNDVDVNEINDENLKEITLLMKKILED